MQSKEFSLQIAEVFERSQSGSLLCLQDGLKRLSLVSFLRIFLFHIRLHSIVIVFVIFVITCNNFSS